LPCKEGGSIQRQEAISDERAEVTEIRRRAKAGERKTGLALEFRVSRQTLYSALGRGACAHVNMSARRQSADFFMQYLFPLKS
jgi:hypothetical protein